jgi:hypothetical protein
VELSPEERKEDVLARLGGASLRARWVLAAESVHSASTLLANLKRTEFPESVWGRYASGREGTVQWFKNVCRRLHEAGFDAPIMQELDRTVTDLERHRTAS